MKPLIKRTARSLLQLSDRLPGAYGRRRMVEQWIYRNQSEVHNLPPIFHYWSNTHLLPMLQQMGFNHPEDFFLRETLRQSPDRPLAIASLGCGNGDMEIRLAGALTAGGARFHIDCIDINPAMLKRGSQQALQLGLNQVMSFRRGDFNQWRPGEAYDVVIANQCLHHVTALEDLFAAIARAIGEHGVLLTSDMIGRNGHRRWPEALAALQPYWQELSPAFRYDNLSGVTRTQYLDRDCSMGSFEGIRAQDVLPLLIRQFNFDLFLPFANIVLVFVERTYGPNFDPARAWDRQFIDRVHHADAQAIVGGQLTPTQMLAVLRNGECSTRLLNRQLTPDACARDPQC